MGRVARLILLVVVSVCVVFVFCAVSKTIRCSRVSPISLFQKWKLWAMYFGGFLRYRKIKDTVVCLLGARFWRLWPKKKDTVVCLLGAQFWRLRPKKKDTVVCLAGCAVVLCQFLVLVGNWQFFCCGGKFLLRLEKKKIQLSVWRVRDRYYDRKKKVLVVCWAQQVFFSSEFAPLHPHLSVDQKSNDEKITWFDSLFIHEIDMRAEELLLKHENDELLLIILLFRLRISTFIRFSPLW